MYIDFYGLKEKPFDLTPDSHFLFLSQKHKEALAHIKYGILEKRGFILITGEIGSGKTTLCRALLKELDRRYKVALVLNTIVSPTGLLRCIIKDLGIKTKARSKEALMDVLYGFLLENRDVVIVIDEAQNLKKPALEQIRLLGNLETEKEKLVQIVLIGQPELVEILSKPDLRQLNQRIAVRYHLHALNREETKEYIYHRLKIAGDNGRIVFQEDALETIYNYSGGVPRIVNIVCDYCLVNGYVKETIVIDKNIVDEAIKETQGISPSEVVFV